MRTEGLPRYLMLDFNAYFASVEQQVRPELRGRPVAVVPIEGTDSTCAIAASYEAKRMGVKTAMRIFEARKVCPDLVCVPARHDLYVEYHERLMAEVANHLPIHKIGSIDECSCRLIGSEREPLNAKKIALGMKAGIHGKVGEHLHCSIGIAPTLLLAKIATKMQKPDGLVVIEEHELPGPLLKMQLTDLARHRAQHGSAPERRRRDEHRRSVASRAERGAAGVGLGRRRALLVRAARRRHPDTSAATAAPSATAACCRRKCARPTAPASSPARCC